MEEAKHLTTATYTEQQATERKQNQYTTTYPGPSELITKAKQKKKNRKTIK